jgi:hypothetical protein
MERDSKIEIVNTDDDPWESLLHDPRPRPELAKACQEALQDFYEDRTIPLNPDNMP